MDVILSLEHESFKLSIGADGNTHNFIPKARKIELSACKNSSAAFQIVLQCDSAAAVNLGTQPWFSEFEEVGNIRFEHIGDLDFKLSHLEMIADDNGTLFADVLLRQEVVQIKSGVPHSIYAEIPLNEQVRSGKYTGIIRAYESSLFEDEELICELKYTLNVYDVSLPEPSKRSFYLDLWQHNSNIARKAEVRLWSDRHFEIIEQYIKTLAQLGQKTITAVVTEIPWCGQRCFTDKNTPSNLFEYSMVSVVKNSSGYFYDYSVLDRYVELCFKYNINTEIEVFGLLNNWQSVTDGYYNYTNYCDILRIRYRDTDGTYKYMRKAKDIEDYIKSIHAHFIEKGWIDIVRVAVDEPWELEVFNENFERLRKLAPKFKYKAAIGKYEFYKEFNKQISDFAPSVCCFLNEYSDFGKAVSEGTHNRFLWYICCSPDEPNTYIRNSSLEIRYITVLTHYFGLRGLLRWAYTIWTERPREDIRSMYPAGDTHFVSPANDMTPLLSLRYKSLLRAIEDYELLEMLKTAGKGDVVNEVYNAIITNRDFTDFYDNTVNRISYEKMTSAKQNDWDKIRKNIYNALIR